MSKKFDLEAYKKTIKVANTPLKQDEYIILNDCLHSVLGMPGIPKGHINQIWGKTDTGKTSLMFHIAAEAQKQDVLPVIIITEGKVDWDRALAMGFNKEEAIVNEDLPFLEDVFDFINKITSDVSMGVLTKDVVIFWDSLGNTISKDQVEIEDDGTWSAKPTMMKAANVITNRMRVISKKINDTRKVSYPKTVTLVVLNKCYTTPNPYGPATLTPYGGDGLKYSSTLVLKTARVKKLTAVKDGKDVGFGIISKISVEKNHLTNVSNSGEFIITANEIFPNEPSSIKDYKDRHKDQWNNVTDIKEVKDE